jgi:hypothetical protein
VVVFALIQSMELPNLEPAPLNYCSPTLVIVLQPATVMTIVKELASAVPAAAIESVHVLKKVFAISALLFLLLL